MLSDLSQRGETGERSQCYTWLQLSALRHEASGGVCGQLDVRSRRLRSSRVAAAAGVGHGACL
eukprot:6210050-Pleurochrysis_carterae.AAC.6